MKSLLVPIKWSICQGLCQLIGFIVIGKLEAFACLTVDQLHQQLYPNAAVWKSMEDILFTKKANRSAGHLNAQAPRKGETGLNWFKWQEQFDNYLRAFNDISSVLLNYLIQKDKQEDWAPAIHSMAEVETLLYPENTTASYK